MTAIQLKNVKKYLTESSFTHTDEWLSACIEWVKENCSTVTDAILRSQVLEQWQDANLEDMESRCLPANLSGQRCVKLTGRYGLQVNLIQDIGESAYNQWNRLKKLENENTNVAATDSTNVKNSWEPKPRRCLYLTMTDGSQTVYGMELIIISSLSLNVKPGAKIIIMGPVECRRGVFQLKQVNVKVIGGEVEDLVEKNSVESVLRNALHNPPEGLAIPNDSRNEQKIIENSNIIGEFPDTLDVPEEAFSVFDDDEFFMEIDESEILASASANRTARANAETQKIDFNTQVTQGDIIQIQPRQNIPEPGSRSKLLPKTGNNQNLSDVKKMPPPRTFDPDSTKMASKFVTPQTKKDTISSTSRTVKNNKSTTLGFKGSKGTPTSTSTGVKSKKQLKIDGYMKPIPVTIKPPTPQKDIEEILGSNNRAEIINEFVLESDEDEDALMEVIEGSFAAELEKAEKESIAAKAASLHKSSSSVTINSPPLGVVHPTNALRVTLPIMVSKQPYVFLKQVQENWDQLAETRQIVYVKACIATVVSNIQVCNGEWTLSVSINDGTGFLNCRISYQILNDIIGFTPAEMKRIKSTKTPEAKDKIAKGMGILTTTLVHLNTIFGIEVGSDPVIIEFGDIRMHHTRGLKDRISHLLQ